MAVARTTKIITTNDDVFTITTTPLSGETQAQVDARHRADIIILATFVEQQMGRVLDRLVCEAAGVDTEREQDPLEEIDVMATRHMEEINA